MTMAATAEVADVESPPLPWGWLLVLGIALVVIGSIALAVPLLTTLTSVVAYAWLLVFSGAFEAVAAFWSRTSRSVVLHLLGGILSIVVGVLLASHPGIGAAGLTLLLAAYFLVGGLFRIGAAVSLRMHGWGWAVAGGAVTTLLGVVIWAEWPLSTLWVIGTLVAVEVLFRGMTLIGFALAVHKASVE